MKHSMVPWEVASKQPKAGISSPPAKTWILSRPPLISSTILPSRWAAPCSTSSAGVQVVDMRHWKLLLRDDEGGVDRGRRGAGGDQGRSLEDEPASILHEPPPWWGFRPTGHGCRVPYGARG